MTRSRLAIVTTALIAAVSLTVPAPAEAGWFGLHIGDGGVGVSLGFGSWWAWTDAWASGPTDLDFDVALSGYGEWVRVEGLGRVWRPWVAADWRPYTNGRWVWTNVGWTWVAYEPWGYVPHHFGNWALTPAGWAWVPGVVYTPASVVWVGSGGLVGWYACPPHGWSHAHRGYWNGYERGSRDGYRSGYSDGWDDARYASFVAWDHLADDDLPRRAVVGYAVPRGSRVQGLAAPPSRSEVARRSGRPVPEARLEQRTVRVSGRAVTIARPAGLERSVESHADDTVRRALSPRVSRELESARSRPEPVERANTPRVTTRPATTATRPQASPPGVLRSQPAPSVRPSATTPNASRRSAPITRSTQRPSATRGASSDARIQPAPATRIAAGTGRAMMPATPNTTPNPATNRASRLRQPVAPERSPSVAGRADAAPTARRVETRAHNAPSAPAAGASVRPAAGSTASSRRKATTVRPAPREKTGTTKPARARRRSE